MKQSNIEFEDPSRPVRAERIPSNPIREPPVWQIVRNFRPVQKKWFMYQWTPGVICELGSGWDSVGSRIGSEIVIERVVLLGNEYEVLNGNPR